MNDKKMSLETCSSRLDEAEFHLDQKKYKMAVDSCRDIESLYSTLLKENIELRGRCFSVVGLSLYHLDELKEALLYFNKLLEDWPNGTNTLFMRAKCYDFLDRLEAAEKDYRRVSELAPNTPAINFFLGVNLESQCKYREAMTAYKAAIEIDGADLESLERLEYLEKNIDCK